MSGYSTKKLLPAIATLETVIEKAMKEEDHIFIMVSIALLADCHNMLVDMVRECREANTDNFVIIPMHDVEGMSPHNEQ